MNDLFLALALLSIIGLIVGLISPNLFKKIFKKRTNRKTTSLVFGIGIVIFFVLFGVTAKPSQNTKSDDATTTPSQSSTTPVQEATTPPKVEYQEIANFSGEGDKKTETFTIISKEWFVDWSVNSTAKDKAILLAYDLYNVNDKFNAVKYFTAGGDKTSDRITYDNGPGNFYLQVWATENNWSISIKQPK